MEKRKHVDEKKAKTKYKNDKEYHFSFGNVNVLATFDGLTSDVIEKFNMLCAREKLKAYNDATTNIKKAV